MEFIQITFTIQINTFDMHILYKNASHKIQASNSKTAFAVELNTQS